MSKLIRISAIVMLAALTVATFRMPTANASCYEATGCQPGTITFYNGDSCTSWRDCIEVRPGKLLWYMDDAIWYFTLDHKPVPICAPMCNNNICSFDPNNYTWVAIDECKDNSCDE